jgi:hypothetical protein
MVLRSSWEWFLRLTEEEWLGLEKECIANGGAREKEIVRE